MVLKSVRNERGQALFEYMLLLVTVLTVYIGFIKGLERVNLQGRFMSMLTNDYARAYQFGTLKPNQGGGTPNPYKEDRVYLSPRP